MNLISASMPRRIDFAQSPDRGPFRHPPRFRHGRHARACERRPGRWRQRRLQAPPPGVHLTRDPRCAPICNATRRWPRW